MGLKKLDDYVQVCQNPNYSGIGNQSGQIKFQFHKEKGKNYSLVKVQAAPSVEKLASCIQEKFKADDNMRKEVQEMKRKDKPSDK
jgi:hypothetical protein